MHVTLCVQSSESNGEAGRRLQGVHDQETIPAALARLLTGPQLWALHALIALGVDVIAYQPLGGEPTDWTLWVEVLARQRPDRDGRVTLDDWCVNWRTYF